MICISFLIAIVVGHADQVRFRDFQQAFGRGRIFGKEEISGIRDPSFHLRNCSTVITGRQIVRGCAVRMRVKPPDMHTDRIARTYLLGYFQISPVFRRADTQFVPNALLDVLEICLALPITIQINGSRHLHVQKTFVEIQTLLFDITSLRERYPAGIPFHHTSAIPFKRPHQLTFRRLAPRYVEPVKKVPATVLTITRKTCNIVYNQLRGVDQSESAGRCIAEKLVPKATFDACNHLPVRGNRLNLPQQPGTVNPEDFRDETLRRISRLNFCRSVICGQA